MEMDERKSEPMCPIVDIDGFIADGKQFDLDITLANDHRNVIYGIVRDCFKEPVSDAVVKLVEIEYKCGKKELKPVSHTFTDEDGEFIFETDKSNSELHHKTVASYVLPFSNVT